MLSVAAAVVAAALVPAVIAQAQETYAVRSGDTLSGIAARTGFTVQAIANANGISNPDLIYAGTTLVLPGSAQTVSLAQPVAATQAVPSGSVQEQFAAGYRSVHGPENFLQHILQRVIPCESSYNVHAYSAAGPYYGLMQFLPATWQSAGGGDYFSAWQQGANTGRLIQKAAPTTQWPVCWNR
jgi:LysM repeat protein